MSRYLPTVLTKEEVFAIINNLSGVYQLVVKLLYGTGLRQSESIQCLLQINNKGEQEFTLTTWIQFSNLFKHKAIALQLLNFSY